MLTQLSSTVFSSINFSPRNAKLALLAWLNFLGQMEKKVKKRNNYQQGL